MAETPTIPRSPLDSPYAIRHQQPVQTKTGTILDPFGRVIPPDDPAWRRDEPLKKKLDAKAEASIIYREIPLSTVSTSWTVNEVRCALGELTAGFFDQPAQLCDALGGDDRVQATMGSRSGGLLGSPIRHRVSQLPKLKDSKAAKECHEAWMNAWPKLATEASLSELHQWGVMMGFGLGQLVWEYDEGLDVHCPYLLPWHPRYTYFHWTMRRFVAITLDGQAPVIPGDAHWVLHAPNGEYRGWMHGAVRAIAQPWLLKAFGYRDWGRYSERHGLPIFKALTPAAGDPTMISNFVDALSQLGQESVIQLPQGVEKEFSYDLQMLEAQANTWQGFAELIDRCEKAITLAIMYQNLTTDVKEGSLAAARVHGDVRQAALEKDARALSHTVYTQIARPFAAMNFGDPDLAPVTTWDVTPEDDKVLAAKVLLDFATALAMLRRTGIEIGNVVEFAKVYGIKLGKAEVNMVDPANISTDNNRSAAFSAKEYKTNMRLWKSLNAIESRLNAIGLVPA